MAKIIVFANQKGGVGKTTTAVNLSSCVAALGYKVLLIDLDAQGNASTGLGINLSEIQKGVYSLLVEEEDFEKCVIHSNFNIDIIPADVDLAGASVLFLEKKKKEFLLKKCLSCLPFEYDFIFIDSPPSLDILTINALVAANTVLIPLQCEYYALEGVAQLLKTIFLVQQKLNPTLEIEGVLMTMQNSTTKLSSQVIENAKHYFHNKVYDIVIPRNVRLSEAPSFGKPINFYDKNSPGGKAYSKLAKVLTHMP